MSTTLCLAALGVEESPLNTTCSISLETIDGLSSEGSSDGMSAEHKSSSECDGLEHDPYLVEEVGPRQSSTQSKPRKQVRSARPNNNKNKPICLDWLNGRCHRLRSYCRLYHPKLSEDVPEATEEKVQVCKVCPKRTVDNTYPLDVHGDNTEELDNTSPVDVQNAAFLFYQLQANPEHTVQLLFQHGLCPRQLLPLLHAMTLNDSRTAHAYVTFLASLRQCLSVAQRQEIDELFFVVVKAWVSRALEVDPSRPRSTIFARVRGVRNVRVCAEALACSLLGTRHIADIISLLSPDLQAQSTEQQDLRVLLLSHLLAAVFHSYAPAMEDCQRIEGFVCLQPDTQMALERLLQVAAQQARGPCAALAPAQCASGSE